MVKSGMIKALAIGGATALSCAARTSRPSPRPSPGSNRRAGRAVSCRPARRAILSLTIQRETAKVLKLPDVVERLKSRRQRGVSAATPAEFDARFHADIVKFAKIIEDAKIPKLD